MKLSNMILFFASCTVLFNTLLADGPQTLTLSKRQLCDLELILNGGFAPLKGFLNKNDYESVVTTMRLSDGTLWPIPIILDLDATKANSLKANDHLILQAEDGTSLAVMTVEDIYQPNKQQEAQLVYGTTNTEHPGVSYLMKQTKDYYIGGTVEQITLPHHPDFTALRKTPAELKQYFKDAGITRVVAFQTRNPLHRAHFELTVRAQEQQQAHLLLHPVVGLTKPGDIDHFTRVKCYQQVMKYYTPGSATLSLLPLSMRMAGPREALWHAIIRKNHGCTHFIVGRDHAGPGQDSTGKDFYGPYDAQVLVARYETELGITMVPFQEMAYVETEDKYYPMDAVPHGAQIKNISGTQFRKMLETGATVPSWFSFPEVVAELRKAYPAHDKKGFTVFFTGLSGAGKSTIASALAMKLMELQDRSITLLDGDLVRLNLSQGLGFSKKDRSLNVQRVGYVAHEITKHRGIAICALIAPYLQDRQANRELINAVGTYIEVHVATPISTCEERDTKGLYQKARLGMLKEFTGVSDPYEEPKNPELTIDTSKVSLDQAVDQIVSYLKTEGYVALTPP